MSMRNSVIRWAKVSTACKIVADGVFLHPRKISLVFIFLKEFPPMEKSTIIIGHKIDPLCSGVPLTPPVLPQ